MSNISVNRVTNANIYVDGRSLLGRAEEISLPTVKQIMSEHKALGMNGKFELPAGIDKLETRIKWNSFYRDTMVKAANPDASVNIQCRSSIKNWGSSGVLSEVPCVVHLTAQFKDFPLGNFKQHDNVELESNLNVTYCKLVIDGTEVLEVDVLANIHKVNGVDILAKYRANLGI
jgi:P2 family phage contractile tail tube protein